MSKTLQYINLIGVMVLTVLCAAQWRINRLLNLEAQWKGKIELEQVARIAELEKSIQGSASDLDSFREQIQKQSKLLHDAETKSRAAQQESAQLSLDRDQFKDNLAKWNEAVRERDESLAKAREQIELLNKDRNQAVTRFNDLAEKYNGIVAELNTRTTDFNALIEKYNELAKTAGKK